MKLTKTQREQLKNKFSGHCAYCGCELGAKWHADHIEPVKRELISVPNVGIRTTGELTRPHLDTIENMNPACVPCNSNKSSIPLERWRKMIEHYRDVQLLRDSTHARHLHRFGLIEIKNDPVVFFFETYKRGIPQVILDAEKCRHGYDVACLLCGFGSKNGKRVWRSITQ